MNIPEIRLPEVFCCLILTWPVRREVEATLAFLHVDRSHLKSSRHAGLLRETQHFCLSLSWESTGLSGPTFLEWKQEVQPVTVSCGSVGRTLSELHPSRPRRPDAWGRSTCFSPPLSHPTRQAACSAGRTGVRGRSLSVSACTQ